MATIARIIVTDPDLKNKRQLFSCFIAESKQHLSNGKKHQFVLLPAGFVQFETHFIKKKIGGKKVAILDCNDLSIFSPRHQHLFSPFKNELKDNRRVDTPTGKIKCPFIDATLDFCPEIVLQLAHTEGQWAAKWTKFNTWLQRKSGKELQHFATGLKKNSKDKKQYTLSGTQRGDVINFVNGELVDE